MTLPAIDDLAALGGEMANYDPVTDPTVELDASFDNKTRANVAAQTQTAIRAQVSFPCVATGSSTPQGHWAVWGNAPSVAPAVARSSAGRYQITWPTSVDDELGESHAVNLVSAQGNLQAGAFFHVQCVKDQPHVWNIYIFDAAGTLVDPTVGLIVDVWLR